MTENPRIAELRRRIEKDRASIAFAQLAEEYRRGGDFRQAVRICRDGLARHPGYLSAQVTLGRALMELGEYDAARQELESVLKVAPDNLAAIRALAVIHQLRRHVSAPAHDVPAPEEPQPPSAQAGEGASVEPLDAAPIPATEAVELSAPEPVNETAVLPPLEHPVAVPATLAPPAAAIADWMIDVDFALDLPEPMLDELSAPPLDEVSVPMLDQVPAPLLDAPDPALAHLEAWLAAIVSGRLQPR